MSVNRNFTRTLSGANSFTIDNLELASHRNTIRINGNSGNAGDVLGKDENNRLVFQTLAPFVIDPNSIDGSKLTDNISITTTGNYSGNSMELTGNLEVDSNVTILGNLSYAGDLNIDDLVVDSLTLDADFVGNGNINLNQHQIVGDYVNLNINGSTGSIVCFQLTSKDSMLVEDTLNVTGLITGGGGLTLTNGNITLNTGSINLTAGNVIASAGDIECVDLETTGEITGGDNITIIGNYSSIDGNITLTNGNISVVDVNATNGFFDDITLPKTGTAVITLNGTNGNINTNGNFTTTSGNIHTSSGNIFTATGDIHANGGYVRGDELRFLTKLQLGNSATPSIYLDNTELNVGTNIITTSHTGNYLSNDFALELTEANSHAKIGGNLKVDGTIYGTIVGDVSETHINGQSLRIHDLGDEGGDTGIQIEDGYDLRMYSDAGTTKTIELDSSSGDITATGDLSLTGDYSSTNGNITLTNGNITLTNGTLFGNVEGEISEDHINGQSLIIENLGVLGDTGIEVRDGYDISTFSDGGTTKTFAIDGATGDYNSKNGDITLTNGDITLTNGDITLTNGDINRVNNILQYGTTINMVNSGTLLMNNGLITDNSGGGSSQQMIIDFNSKFIKMRNTNADRIDIDTTDIRLNNSLQTETIHLLSQSGNIQTSGNITLTNGDIIMNNGLIRNTDTTSSHMDLDFDNGVIAIRNGTGGTETLMSISSQFITIKNKDYPSINGTQITDTFYRLNDSSNGSVEPRVLMDSVDGLSLITGSAQFNLTLSPSGNITYESGSGDLIGYNASSTSYTNNSTRMEHFRLDETNYKYHTYEIGVNIPLQSYFERTISTTSTAWFDLNDKLTIKLISNAETNSFFVVDFSFYAVITAGARLWFKLFDSDIGYIDNFYQPSYLYDTTSQCFLDTNGASDFAGVHNVRFLVRNYPANTTKNIRVACWVITNSGHKVIFKSGGHLLGSTSNNPSTSYDKYPPQFLQAHKLLNSTNINTNTPTGWSQPAGDDY